jgi:hypothetical protein
MQSLPRLLTGEAAGGEYRAVSRSGLSATHPLLRNSSINALAMRIGFRLRLVQGLLKGAVDLVDTLPGEKGSTY